jgi:ABC-type amino acid transport substrate-binding protein
VRLQPTRLLILVLLAVVAGLIWLFVRARGNLLSPRDATWERIRREGVLRVGMDATYLPFEVVDQQGRFSGYDVDLAQALADRWGARAEFVAVHFDGLYDALQANKFDLIISALPYDRTQTRDLRFSQSYFNAGLVLLARADNERLRSVNDLSGQWAGAELGSEAHQWLRTLSRDRGIGVEVVAWREPGEALGLLREGAVSAIVCDRVTAYGYIKQGQAEGLPLRLVGPPLTDAPYVIATRPGASELLREVNAALEEWRAGGFLEELESRWF